MVDHQALRERLKNPLTPEHRAIIEDNLETLRHVHEANRKARAAGIDVSDSERIAKDAETKLRSLKQVYFPNGG